MALDEEARSIEVTFEALEGEDELVLTLTREWAAGLAIAIARLVEAGLDEQALQPEIDERRRADLQALNRCDIAFSRFQVRAEDEEPVSVLGLRGEELGTCPARECGGYRMRRTADEVYLPVAQHLERAVNRKYQLELHVEPFPLEKPELHRGCDREVGIRDHVGDSDLHHASLAVSSGAE